MIPFSRRHLLGASLLMTVPFCRAQPSTEAAFAQLERKHGGRLGVAILNTANGRTVNYRADERFAMCSTFKYLAAAFVLARVDAGKEDLHRRISFTKDVLLPHSPITEKHVGSAGMTVAELCRAAITVSDNAAANLLLDSFGGPKALTLYVRSLGDRKTRLDRREPELNKVPPGDPRDTTSPAAMLRTLQKVTLGNALSAHSREQLNAWLMANTTGAKRIRAGVTAGWRVGDKTGSWDNHAINDVAVIWPPDREPILVTAYYSEAPSSEDEQAAVFSVIGRIAISL